MTTSTQPGPPARARHRLPLGRNWRRLRRRPMALQVRTIVMILAVIALLVAWLLMAPSGTPGAAQSAGASEASVSGFQPTPVGQASTSSRGISATAINVVFPVISLSSVAGQYDVASDPEFAQQANAIHLYVNQINDAGGINGRKIKPMIVSFNPADDSEMRSLCKQWTEGNPPVFAVLDGVGTWEGDNELCITQEGHTPMIAAWSTTTNWTDLGSPYLWWTGADNAPVLAATVDWGLSSGRLGHGKKVGVVVSDQASDQAALNDYLLPDLKKIGITPQIETVAGTVGETASTDSDATLAAERFKEEGVQSVIPLLPDNAFLPYLGAETSQQYFPTLLLSDYQFEIEVALGLIPEPYEKALNGQEGVTTQTLGGSGDPLASASQGGYVPGASSCYDTWHKAYPKAIKGTTGDTIEEQGPIVEWCGAIRLFADAATKAGKDLNRRTFVEAMSKITNFAASTAPVWSFGPNKMYGPTQYEVVKIHNNVPPSSQCVLTAQHKAQGTCWVLIQNWKPLPNT